MKNHLKKLVVFILVSCIAACYPYDENFYSFPLPETLEGKIVDEGGNFLGAITIEAFIYSANKGVGPEGTVRGKISRFIRIKTNSNGQYMFDFRAESKRLANDHPTEAPILSRYFHIHINNEEYVRVKFVDDTTFVVKKSHLRPNDLEN